jgi:PleD family two-component response regulator
MSEFERPNILLVDDRSENLLALEGTLEDEDYNLFKATSGQEALRLVLKHDFDLILLDVQMPEMDGFEVAKLLRSKKKTEDIPIIFITAINKERKYIDKGYEVGAENYLFKPIEPEVLKCKMRASLQYHDYRKRMKLHEARLIEKKKEKQEAKNNLSCSVPSKPPLYPPAG